jgi:hypothetical protein
MESSRIAAALARALHDAKITQYRLIREAGLTQSTARRALGQELLPQPDGTTSVGEPSLAAAEKAARLAGLELRLIPMRGEPTSHAMPARGSKSGPLTRKHDL